MNNILVLGSGAREHTIIDKLLDSQTIKTVFVYPGNDGIFNQSNKIAKTTITNYENSLVEFCNNNKIHFVISGAETLLVDGLYDYLQNHNINCFGPNKAGALIEGSKAFSKHFMVENNIPTANYNTFTSFDTFKQYYEKSIKNENNKYVVKASGLASGKGVVIPNTNKEVYEAVEDMLVNKKFNSASS